MRDLLRRAMAQSDDLVVVFDYQDSQGHRSQRVVSPIRFVGPDRFLGLCLSREEPRQFHLKGCSQGRIALATQFTMPVPIVNYSLAACQETIHSSEPASV